MVGVQRRQTPLPGVLRLMVVLRVDIGLEKEGVKTFLNGKNPLLE
jgi:hypothetical protein